MAPKSKGKHYNHPIAKNLRRIFEETNVKKWEANNGFTRGSISKYQNGHALPLLETILKIAAALGIPPEKLTTDSNNKKKDIFEMPIDLGDNIAYEGRPPLMPDKANAGPLTAPPAEITRWERTYSFFWCIGEASTSERPGTIYEENKIYKVQMPTDIVLVRIIGNSMAPRGYDGEYVVVDRIAPVYNGDFVLAIIYGNAQNKEEGMFFKQVFFEDVDDEEYCILHSINPSRLFRPLRFHKNAVKLFHVEGVYSPSKGRKVVEPPDVV